VAKRRLDIHIGPTAYEKKLRERSVSSCCKLRQLGGTCEDDVTVGIHQHVGFIVSLHVGFFVHILFFCCIFALLLFRR
jgi:hypothetical protein